jgi:prepilin-type N-terminal cleavage/methylation domain-containing protein
MRTTLPPRRAARGFTLVELVITVVILSILAAVAVPLYINLSYDARVAATKGNLAAFRERANIAYLATRKEYPDWLIESISYDMFNEAVMLILREPGSDALLPHPLMHNAPANAVVGGKDILRNANDTPPADLGQFCATYLERAPGTDSNGNGYPDGWIFFYQVQQIHAFTDDCSRANPAAW